LYPASPRPKEHHVLGALDEGEARQLHYLLAWGAGGEMILLEVSAAANFNHLTPADVYVACGQTVLTRRENIKLKTFELRRRLHHQTAASTSTQMGQFLS